MERKGTHEREREREIQGIVVWMDAFRKE